MADKVLPEAGWFENFAIALNSFNLTESVAGQVAKLGEIDNPATKLIHTAISTFTSPPTFLHAVMHCTFSEIERTHATLPDPDAHAVSQTTPTNPRSFVPLL